MPKFFLSVFNSVKNFYSKYEKILLPLSFFFGLFWDNFTLRRVDMFYENAVFIWNLFQVLLFIIIINAYSEGRLKWKIFSRIVPFLPLFLQFSFGNLFSGFLVFYFRSGSFWASWLFLLGLGVLFVGNEFFRKRYTKLTLQLGVFFIAIFTYFVFALPVILNKMGPYIFILSGIAALLFISLVGLVLFFIIPNLFKSKLKHIIFTIFGIYFSFQFLYFTNIIPPIPLSLKDSGIFHSLKKINSNDFIYSVNFEPAEKFAFFRKQSDIFHITKGEPVYAYSSVFSPAQLNVKMFHLWYYFDPLKKNWVERARIPLPPIIGGRDGGYRGYSYILNAKPGIWKVEVATERGQVLGRQKFTVIEVAVKPPLNTGLR